MRLVILLAMVMGCKHGPPTPAVELAEVEDVAPEPVDPRVAQISAAHALAVAGDPEAAIVALQTMLQSDPDHVGTLWALAAVLDDAGLPGADLVAERAHGLSPSATHHNARALRALDLGAHAAAITELQAAIALKPAHRAANLNLGWLALDSGDFATARTCFERLAPLGDPDAQLGLAIALRGSGDLDGAAALYTTLLSADADNVPARVNAALLEARYRGDHAAALSILDAHPGEDDAVSTLRTDVQGWLAEAEAQRAAQAAADQLAREERRKHKAALAELTDLLDGWRAEAAGDPCRVRVIEGAELVLELGDGAIAVEVRGMWDACTEQAPAGQDSAGD